MILEKSPPDATKVSSTFLPRSLTKIDFSITGLQECNNQEVAAQATKK